MIDSHIRSWSFIHAAKRTRAKLIAGTCGNNFQQKLKILCLTERQKFLFYTAVDLFSKNETDVLRCFLTKCYDFTLYTRQRTVIEAAAILIKVKRFIIEGDGFCGLGANAMIA